jgi:hypothetical protein
MSLPTGRGETRVRRLGLTRNLDGRGRDVRTAGMKPWSMHNSCIGRPPVEIRTSTESLQNLPYGKLARV